MLQKTLQKILKRMIILVIYGNLTLDESQASNTSMNVSPVDDIENDCLKEITVAASVHREEDEFSEELVLESETDLEMDEDNESEKEVNEKVEDSGIPQECQWNINLERVGKMTLTKEKLTQEKRKERKNVEKDRASKKKKL